MSDRADVLAAQSVSYRVHDVSLVSKTDLGVAAGEVVAVLGPNGAGKSTLLKVMAGELSPASGRVVVDGRDLAILKAGELARLRAVVAQSSNLSFPFTVREVVRLGVSVPGLSRENPRIERAVGDAIGRVGLAAFSGRLFTELSGGERQRTHIARALCQLSVARDLAGGGKILLLDEPTSSLDVGHQVVVLEALRREADAGTAILMVMHDLNLAAAFADRRDHEPRMHHSGRSSASGDDGSHPEPGLRVPVVGWTASHRRNSIRYSSTGAGKGSQRRPPLT